MASGAWSLPRSRALDFVAPELPTCNGKVFDVFVVTNNFIHTVAGAQRINGVGTTPHFPARLLLRGDARRFDVRNLTRPKRVPPVLMHGPQPKPPSYEFVLRKVSTVPCRLENSVEDTGAQTAINEATKE